MSTPPVNTQLEWTDADAAALQKLIEDRCAAERVEAVLLGRPEPKHGTAPMWKGGDRGD